MSASLLIVLRETVEGSLLIGILLACLDRTGHRRHFAGIWLGVGLGILASALLGTALLLTLGNVKGTAEEVFEGAVMWAAVAVLTYVLWWMRVQGRSLVSAFRAEAEAALSSGSATLMGTLAFLAVFREGAEAVLYLGAAASTSPWHAVSVGAALGFAIAILLAYLIYRGGMRFLTPQRFLTATTVVLLVFAAGMVGRATLAFQTVGIFPGTIAAWDTSQLLSETSGLGGTLRALVGYTAMPSVLQVALVLGYLALIVALFADLGAGRSIAASRSAEARPDMATGSDLAIEWGPGFAIGAAGSADAIALRPDMAVTPRSDLAATPSPEVAPEERFSPIGTSYAQPLYRALRRGRLTKLLPASMLVLLVVLVSFAVMRLDIGPFDNRGPLEWGPFTTAEVQNNVFNFAMWILWLPLLTLLTVVLGRFWCGNLCPLRLVTEWGRCLAARLGLKGARVTAPLRLGWLLPLAFLLITFLVFLLSVQRDPSNGALLFGTIFGLAFVFGFVSRRGAWCRYFCPVGGWLARMSRLSPLGLQADRTVCATCAEKPCLTGTARAGKCPAYLNPPRLETSRYCLKCWDCVVNCPLQKSSLKLGWRLPGAELLKPSAPDVWESVFVASLLGVFVAVGHRSQELTQIPWPVLFFGLVSLTTLVYVVICGVAGQLAGVPARTALATFGYVFLPLEFATALIAFGDGTLEFFGIVQPAAVILLTIGFVWSVVLGASILRNHSRGRLRALAGAMPIGATLMTVLLVWFKWYAAGGVVDLS